MEENEIVWNREEIGDDILWSEVQTKPYFWLGETQDPTVEW